MKNIGIKLSCFLLIAVFTTDIWAAGIYINQNFDTLNLNSKPTGWTTGASAKVTTDPYGGTSGVPDPINHGKVLTLTDTLVTGTDGYKQLEIPFPQAITGENIRIAYDWYVQGFPLFPGVTEMWGLAVYEDINGNLPPSASNWQTWESTSQELLVLYASTYTDDWGLNQNAGWHRIIGAPFDQNKYFGNLQVIAPREVRGNTNNWNTYVYTIYWNAATNEYDHFDVEIWLNGSGQYIKASASKSPGLGHSLSKMRLWSADPNGSHAGTGMKLSIDNVWVATASIPRYCGEYGIVSNPGDINQDCHVDMKDMVLFASKWLSCTDPQNATCSHWWDTMAF